MANEGRTPVSAFMRSAIERSSWIRQMFEEGNRLKQIHGADQVFDFSLGNPSVPPPSAFRDVLVQVAGESRASDHRYMTNVGLIETREWVAGRARETHGLDDIDASCVVMTCGAAGGLNIFFRSILDPGDEIILLSPYFPEYLFYVENHGGKVVVVPTDGEFQPDLDAIEAAVTERTRAIVINSPNNPTGVVYRAELVEELGRRVDRIADERGAPLFLVSDEPYRRLIYTDARQPSALAACRHGIVCTSFSKDLGLAGERIGYVLLNPRYARRGDLFGALAIATRTLGFVNAPAFMQRVLPRCGDLSVDLGKYRANRDLIVDGLREAGYEMPSPDGAFFVFPAVPGGDDVAFCHLLRERRVLTVPGRGFGTPGHIRISYAVEPRVIERALPRFAEALQAAAAEHGEG
ncbi:MAG: pyridoxal phosphate-dependent aminotransferase [Planctomycetota bacterium]